MTLPTHPSTAGSATHPQPRSPRGIYTLGNDIVFDQLVALLNSIEVHMGDIPVIICPYDDRMDRVREEIRQRPNVSIFEDQEAIARWDEFTVRTWKTHPIAKTAWQTEDGFKVHRMGVHRRFVGLDGPFEHYIYLDADILVLDSLEKLFAPLATHDWVVYDFQHTDPTHVFNVNSPLLDQHFDGADGDIIRSNIFCSGMYASRSGLFSSEQCEQFIQQLADGEADMLYHMAPDQTILNYMVLRSNASVYNLAHQLPSEHVTGCCVTSPHFQSPNPIPLPPICPVPRGDRPIDPSMGYAVANPSYEDAVLRDDRPADPSMGYAVANPSYEDTASLVSNPPTLHDRHTPLTYLHYIGISSKVFGRLCAGENLDFPYRDLFLYYRYLHEPDRYPTFQGRAKPYNPPPSFKTKVMRKLGLVRA